MKRKSEISATVGVRPEEFHFPLYTPINADGSPISHRLDEGELVTFFADMDGILPLIERADRQGPEPLDEDSHSVVFECEDATTFLAAVERMANAPERRAIAVCVVQQMPVEDSSGAARRNLLLDVATLCGLLRERIELES